MAELIPAEDVKVVLETLMNLLATISARKRQGTGTAVAAALAVTAALDWNSDKDRIEIDGEPETVETFMRRYAEEFDLQFQTEAVVPRTAAQLFALALVALAHLAAEADECKQDGCYNPN